MRLRPVRIVSLVLLALFVTAAPVAAALYLEPFRTSLPVGAVYRGQVAGGLSIAAGQELDLFLATFDESISSPDDPALTPVGVLDVDRDGNGTTAFVIPSLPTGRYDLLLHCEPCAAYSFGRVMAAVAQITIVPPLPGTATDTRDPPRSPEPPAGLITAVVAGVLLALRCRRREARAA